MPITFRNDGATVKITPDSSEGQVLFSIEVDGLVTWPELEALCFRLHPPGLTARGHATLVRDASPWLRGPDPDAFEGDGGGAEAYTAALVAEGAFPFVDEQGWPLPVEAYVPCPTCRAKAGELCQGDEGTDRDGTYADDSHPTRVDALARFLADPEAGFGDSP